MPACRRAQEAATALAAARELWSVQERLEVREQEVAGLQQERAALSAQVRAQLPVSRVSLRLAGALDSYGHAPGCAMPTPLRPAPPSTLSLNQVAHLGAQLAEQAELLRKVAEARELQRAAHQAAKELHAEQLRQLNKLLDQVSVFSHRWWGRREQSFWGGIACLGDQRCWGEERACA